MMVFMKVGTFLNKKQNKITMEKKVIITHEVYVNFKLAKLLKEAGFDWQVSAHWVETNKEKETAIVLPKRPCLYNLLTVVDPDCDIFNCCIKNWNAVEDEFQFYYSAPLLVVAQDWVREVLDLNVEVHQEFPGCFTAWITGTDGPHKTFRTYDAALEAGLIKAIQFHKKYNK